MNFINKRRDIVQDVLGLYILLREFFVCILIVMCYGFFFEVVCISVIFYADVFVFTWEELLLRFSEYSFGVVDKNTKKEDTVSVIVEVGTVGTPAVSPPPGGEGPGVALNAAHDSWTYISSLSSTNWAHMVVGYNAGYISGVISLFAVLAILDYNEKIFCSFFTDVTHFS